MQSKALGAKGAPQPEKSGPLAWAGSRGLLGYISRELASTGKVLRALNRRPWQAGEQG